MPISVLLHRKVFYGTLTFEKAETYIPSNKLSVTERITHMLLYIKGKLKKTKILDKQCPRAKIYLYGTEL